MLIPAHLLEMAEINGDVVLAGQDGKIEIWAKALYDKVGTSEADFAALAEKILGNPSNRE